MSRFFFRSSSIMTIDLTTQGNYDLELLLGILEKPVKNGQLGTYQVNQDGFSFTSFKSKLNDK